MDKLCGIYMIRNKVNNNVYIGQAVDIYYRWKWGHINYLNKNIHSNEHLQRAWNKYGQNNFEFKIIEECLKEQLNEKEIYWIAYYDSFNNGYNQTLGGSGNLGLQHSEETKEKIRNFHLGKKLSNDTKKKISDYFKDNPSNSFLGKHHTKESKDKMRTKAIGRKHSEKTKEKFKEIFSGEGNGMYGKHHTEESKDKNKFLKNGESKSNAYIGENNPFFNKHHSEETKKRISNSKKGQKGRTKLTPEQVRQIKIAFCNKDKNITWSQLYNELSKKYNISVSGLQKIKDGSRWADITI